MKDQNSFDLIEAKGEAKSNPYYGSKHIGTGDSEVKQETFQCVQNLPPIIGDDVILKSILQPAFKFTNQKDFPNVIPLKVNYCGSEGSEKDFGYANVHGKTIKYDKTKGFVASSWANFYANEKDGKFTDKEEGLFIKHLTSNVISSKNRKVQTGVTVNSLSSVSPGLMSNSWSNVLLYRPDEQVFKYDPATKSYVQEESKFRK